MLNKIEVIYLVRLSLVQVELTQLFYFHFHALYRAKSSSLKFYTSLTLILFSLSSFIGGKSDKEFLDEILHRDKYDKRILPPVKGELLLLL